MRAFEALAATGAGGAGKQAAPAIADDIGEDGGALEDGNLEEDGDKGIAALEDGNPEEAAMLGGALPQKVSER